MSKLKDHQVDDGEKETRTAQPVFAGTNEKRLSLGLGIRLGEPRIGLAKSQILELHHGLIAPDGICIY